LKSDVKERKFLLPLILTTKIAEFCVKLFLLMREAHIKFFYLEIAKKNKSDRDKIFSFKFGDDFWDFFEAMNEYIMLPMMFCKCFD